MPPLLAITVFGFVFFKTGFVCVNLTVQELALYTRLALSHRNASDSASLALGLKECVTPTSSLQLFLFVCMCIKCIYVYSYICVCLVYIPAEARRGCLILFS